MTEISYEATVTCPKCGYSHKEIMPSDSCLVVYKCKKCGFIMMPKEGIAASSVRTQINNVHRCRRASTGERLGRGEGERYSI